MAARTDRVHGLLLPIGERSLLLPSALVAEIITLGRVVQQPLAAQWILGVINWRSRPVTVCDLSRLWSGGIEVNARSRVAVFYPLAGRSAGEFFAVLTSAEPQPRVLDDAAPLMTNANNENPLFAVTLVLDGRPAAIPNLTTLADLFYPAKAP
ncbi:MAG: chemotaxis protein CheW [Gammaproteobacteria bacterium]|nr:chemotaxis protein CheW [Gammaproteobacteria bacterium]